MTIMKLIDKDAVVAEIERLKKEEGWCQVGEDTADVYYSRGFRLACERIINVLDTLGVKEVDLAKEIDKFYGMYRKNGITFSIEDNQECLDWKEDCNPDFEIGFARHFFELGLKVAQKGE